MMLGILMISIAVIVVFAEGYYGSSRRAMEQKRFGIVSIDEEKYVIIDNYDDEMVVQKCRIKENTLRIETNTYLHTSNKRNICFKTFNDIEME